MTTGKKIIIGLLLFLTIILAGISAYVALDLQQPDDASVAAGYCPAITCPDGTTFPEDNNTPQATCAQREAEACASHGGSAGSGGTCPVGGGSCSGRPIGDVIPTADGSCSCQLNASTGLCGCVASAGTTCDIAPVNDPQNVGSCIGSSIGAACTRDGSQGVCQSAGVTGSDQRCRCALSGNSTPDNGNGGTDPGGQGDNNTCSTRTDCNVGYYCKDSTCQPQGGEGAVCNNSNDACVSGNCQNGKCVVAGTTSNSCNPATNSPCTNGQICNPNTLLCETPASANGDCLSDAQCASGLVCISLRCRTIVDDSNPNVQCISGKWYCGATAGCTTPGTGKLCNLGTISGQSCTVADACANLTANGALTNGMLCDGLTRLSTGEASRGAFVGCSGRQNCFCPGTSTAVGSTVPSGNTVSCFDDIGNDSCGAGTITTTTTNPPGGGDTPTNPSNPVCNQTCSSTCSDGTSCINGVCRNPECATDIDCNCTTTTNQPYCGDSICQTGETCEAVSAGSSSYYNCSNQQLISSCIGIGTSTTPSCYYCGDGIVNGSEQCDYNAPGATNCDTNCTNVTNACIDLVENGPDPIRSGSGNVVEYIIQYSNATTGDPYPNIKLRVGPSGGAIGRDANNTSQSLVSPMAKPTSNDSAATKTYKFVWEAASTAGSAVANGTYDVRVLVNGTESSVESVPACQESITLNSTAPQESVFTLVKSAAEVCTTAGDAQISYTITVTNTGPVSGTINQVYDTIDQDIVSAGIVPSSITPSYGTYSSGVISWVGTSTDRTYSAGQSKNFTYRITIPKSLLVNFYQAGVDNIASVTYSDNSSNFEVNTPINCSVPTKGTSGSVPSTAIFSDSSNYIIFGALLILSGLAVTKMNSGRYVIELVSTITGQTTSANFEKKTLKDVKSKDK